MLLMNEGLLEAKFEDDELLFSPLCTGEGASSSQFEMSK